MKSAFCTVFVQFFYPNFANFTKFLQKISTKNFWNLD